MKIFLDANVVIDFLDGQRRYHNLSVQFFKQAIKNNDKLIISEDILTTVFYVCKKEIAQKKIFDFFELLNTEFMISGFGSTVIEKSIKLCRSNNKFDFEDVLQSVCAESNECDLIITNDKNFPELKVSILPIKEFIKRK